MGSLNIPLIVLISHLSRFVFGTSSPTEFRDTGSEVKFPSSTHPEYTKCKESFGFIDCQNFTNYPSEFMKKLVSEKKNAELFQWCRNKKLSDLITAPNLTTTDPFDTPTNLCASKKASNVKPQGVVVNGTFYYVIQAELNDMKCDQKFTMLQCDKINQTCEYGSGVLPANCRIKSKHFNFMCVQKYMDYKDLMVISENNVNEVLKIVVQVPTCCSCEYKQYD